MLDIAELQVGFKPGDATLAVETLASINGKFVLNITVKRDFLMFRKM